MFSRILKNLSSATQPVTWCYLSLRWLAVGECSEASCRQAGGQELGHWICGTPEFHRQFQTQWILRIQITDLPPSANIPANVRQHHNYRMIRGKSRPMGSTQNRSPICQCSNIQHYQLCYQRWLIHGWCHYKVYHNKQVEVEKVESYKL